MMKRPVVSLALAVACVAVAGYFGVQRFSSGGGGVEGSEGREEPRPARGGRASQREPLAQAELQRIAGEIRAGAGGSWQELQGLCATAAPGDFDRLWSLIVTLPGDDSMKSILQAQIIFELAAHGDLGRTPEIVARLLPDQGDHFAARNAVLERLVSSPAAAAQFAEFVSAVPGLSLELEQAMSRRLAGDELFPQLCASGVKLEARGERLLLEGIVKGGISDQDADLPGFAEGVPGMLAKVAQAQQAGCLDAGAVNELFGKLACRDLLQTVKVLLAFPEGVTGVSPELLPALTELLRQDGQAKSVLRRRSNSDQLVANALPFGTWMAADPGGAESWYYMSRGSLPASLGDELAYGFLYRAMGTQDAALKQRWLGEIHDVDLRQSLAGYVAK